MKRTGVLENLVEKCGGSINSKDEIKKKKLKCLLEKFKIRKEEVEKKLQKEKINTTTKKDLEEELRIVNFYISKFSKKLEKKKGEKKDKSK